LSRDGAALPKSDSHVTIAVPATEGIKGGRGCIKELRILSAHVRATSKSTYGGDAILAERLHAARRAILQATFTRWWLGLSALTGILGGVLVVDSRERKFQLPPPACNEDV
jgi:hypothetical protein